MGKRRTCAILTTLTLGVAVVDPAVSQVGPDARPYIYGRPDWDGERSAPPRRRPPPAIEEDDWRPPPGDAIDRPRAWGRDRPERRRWRDGVCVTARGTCLTRPAPPDAPCGCDIPGFGYKRGQIED
jgi:hypothetical protein